MRIFRNIILWLAAISVMNSSIEVAGLDDTEAYTAHNTIDEVNEYETLVEFIAEEGFDFKDAFPETNNDHSNQGTLLKKHTSLYHAVWLEKPRIKTPESTLIIEPAAIAGVEKPIAGYITLFSPPPDLAFSA